MAEVFLVTESSYDYYAVLQVFADREAADAFKEQYNAASRFHVAEVEAHPLREAGWKPGTTTQMITKLALASGDVLGMERSSECDWRSEHTGQARSRNHQRSGYWLVSTTGDTEKVPAAHDDAVALVQAQIKERWAC